MSAPSLPGITVAVGRREEVSARDRFRRCHQIMPVDGLPKEHQPI